MLTWNTYYVESLRREEQIANAKQDRFIRSVTKDCEPRMVRMSIRMLDLLGSKLVDWGSQLQCRCAEMTMTRSNRAV
jgi:hypothetical protein